MSPEQARGREVDRRTDIWAFGCVLYDMLTGSTPFAAATLSDTLAAILTREPDWSRLPPDTPPAMARLLRRCLQKDTSHRLRDIGDALLELEEALTWKPSDTASHANPTDRRTGVLTTRRGIAVAIGRSASGGRCGGRHGNLDAATLVERSGEGPRTVQPDTAG